MNCVGYCSKLEFEASRFAMNWSTPGLAVAVIQNPLSTVSTEMESFVKVWESMLNTGERLHGVNAAVLAGPQSAKKPRHTYLWMAKDQYSRTVDQRSLIKTTSRWGSMSHDLQLYIYYVENTITYLALTTMAVRVQVEERILGGQAPTFD